MKALVFGKSGQVARALIACGEAEADLTIEAVDRSQADFIQPDACAALVRTTDADVVINAVAYTAVDQAESDEAVATAINGTTPGAIAAACADRGLPFVHISTDYVFDGAGEAPFATDHPTAPLGAYGRSKLAGEEAVRAAGGTHAILRTSWVFSEHGNNFVKTMLRLGAERDVLTIVADQIGGPTRAAHIAQSCLTVARAITVSPGQSGTYHLSGGPDVSWAYFAREIFAQAGLSCAVEDIPSSAYPTPAARPKNSRLDNSQTLATFGIERSDWRIELADVLKKLDR
ncbi:dTDP-4-dehydrorhamnose reductase [Shimia sp. R9_1]|uniref:dTDP-4-dehydrorhamnose reductase n=1 Tax=Shimia sp. R9_1 TaxID=2821111 RepID=UPI001AD966E4|nr:dTDP-4-dehydrorhamnose reductase [Shimia sp. R9_1]MBO9407289.1 dTDP-4-dehydrorhamnose reductase [Shimia sp. R9_1]